MRNSVERGYAKRMQEGEVALVPLYLPPFFLGAPDEEATKMEMILYLCQVANMRKLRGPAMAVKDDDGYDWHSVD